MNERKRTLVYLFGMPGSGKSSLFRALTAERDRFSVNGGACPHIVLKTRNMPDRLPAVIAEIGVDRPGGFPGTDGLSMSIQPKALAFLKESPHTLVLAEGDRLANTKFLAGAKDLGWNVVPVLLDTPERVAAVRRLDRGSNQNSSWLRGRITKTRNLQAATNPVILDGTKTIQELATDLREVIVSRL